MASKRKSTVPCMIPSKSKHVREEIILGSLPELLPTIPEDSILSISGEESGHFSHSSSKSESGMEMQKGGTYSCPKCRFESRDLNYFLDHMHNCHLDFRAQPTFYCLNCGVSVVRFEALALHNANAHPKIMEGLVTASLTVNMRDGVTTVEQSLFTDSGEDYRESGISLTKTPIAKMMKAKGEHKKIVVSHTVEVRKIDTGKDADSSMLTNVPELQNGALSVSAAPAMPRTTVTPASPPMMPPWTPAAFSRHPLASSPTRPKPELCYLTVVSEFPEEQIKLWFTAQRLKQGISWSPEEIEEARRKMFNTVFQGGAPQKQPATQQHINHIVTHHTVTDHPGSKGPNFQMAKVPYGSMKTRPVGVIATQASMSTNPHVTRVSYSTPIVPPKFPSTVRTTTKQLIKEEDPFARDRSCPELKVDPIKISFKRVKMNEPETTSEGVHQEHKSEVFSNTRWPSSQQYEDLSVQTGLPKPEVVRWFSDSRYSHKNGQLKWLETYQRPPAGSEEARGHRGAEAESLRDSPVAKKILVEQDTNKHLEGEAGLNSGQRVMWQDSFSPLLGLMGSEGSGERGRAEESAQPGVMQDPWSERAEDHQQPVASQSLIEQQTDANQARYFNHNA
ncbi:Zinc fingers and homeoboxes protein 3 [Collichthys lucidus]|uniref:Zinc fingers and homeoboxes protein 3 n=1 Tax=Collichthys lucidus TaxID=240159 RepID=A0A4U5U9E6_COLLU|nr:Zinc fingers and homeoboxes protein 3 [Collichthys lucidus]